MSNFPVPPPASNLAQFFPHLLSRGGGASPEITGGPSTNNQDVLSTVATTGGSSLSSRSVTSSAISAVGESIHGSEIHYQTNLDEDLDELQVTPITLYKSERRNNRGSLITVNDRYITYPIRNGLIRVIHQTSVSRVLLRGHENHVVNQVTFFRPEMDLLLSAGSDGHICIWNLVCADESDSITHDIVKKIPIHAQLVRWHPHNSECIGILNQSAFHMVNLANIGPDATVNAQMLGDHGAAMRTLKGSDGSPLNDFIFTPSGQHVFTASQGGTLCLYNLQDRALSPQRSFRPFGQESLHTLLYLTDNTLIIGSKANARISVWTSVTNVVEEPTCLQQLTMEKVSPMTEIVGNEYILQLDSTSTFLLVADRYRPVLHAVHMNQATNQMDNIRDFILTHPILSMTVSNRKPIDRGGYTNNRDLHEAGISSSMEMQLFCVQTTSIQQYHLRADQCFVANAEQDDEEDDQEETAPQFANLPPPLDVVTMEETKMQTVGAVTTEELMNLQPNVVPSGETTTGTTAAEEETQDVSATPSPSSHSLNTNYQSPSMEALGPQISAIVSETIRREMQTLLIPAMSRIVLHTMENAVVKPMQDSMQQLFTDKLIPVIESRMEKISHQMKNQSKINTSSIPAAIVKEVKNPVKESFKECFRDDIIPSFQGATQRMLKQINDTITRSVTDSTSKATTGKTSKMEEKIDQLITVMHELKSSIENQEQAQETEVTSVEALKEEMMTCVKRGDFESAFEIVSSHLSQILFLFSIQFMK